MGTSTQTDHGPDSGLKDAFRGTILFLARAADFLPLIFLVLLVTVIAVEIPDDWVPAVIVGPFAVAVVIALLEKGIRYAQSQA